MTRPIVTDPDKFGGAPFIEGTSITVAEVQVYWEQRGVYAAEIRQRFPELSEAELGAAVTWAPPYEPEFSYVAELEGPSRCRLRIQSSQTGWTFFVSEVSAEGAEELGFDTWEEEWERILLYPETYASKDIVWRNAKTGEVVDIYSIGSGVAP